MRGCLTLDEKTCGRERKNARRGEDKNEEKEGMRGRRGMKRKGIGSDGRSNKGI